MWLWAVKANYWAVLAVLFHTFEVISIPSSADNWDFHVSEQGKTHSYVPSMSLRSAHFVGRVWCGKKQREGEGQKSPKYGSFSHRVKIQQTNNSQQNNSQYQSTKMDITCVIFVSFTSMLSSIIGDNPHQWKPKVSHHTTLTLQTSPLRSGVCFKLNSWPFQQLSPESRQPRHHLKSVDERSRARNVPPLFPKGTRVRERFLPSFPSGFSNKREKNKWKWKVYN